METDNDNSIGKDQNGEYEENKNNNINVEVVQGLIQQTNGENRNDAYEKYEDNGTINSDPLETSDCVRMSVVEVVQEVIPPTNGENQNHAHEEYDNNGTISSGPLETFDVVQSLVYMSNSIGGQEEVITEFSDGFKEKLKTICVSVLKENIEHEESKKIKSLKIAKKLAVFLIEATTRPLYTVVSSERLNNSEEDIPSHFLKASPLLLLAFNQMTDLYKNSSVLRYDAPLKTFAGYVCTALCQIDNTLQSLDNFTFKKVHLADKMKDENVIYSLDSIPAKPLVLDYDDFTNDFDTKSIITKRKCTASNSLATRAKSERISNSEGKTKVTTPDIGFFITKNKKSKKKKTLKDNLEYVYKEAFKNGMSRDEVRKIERTIYKNAGIDMEDEDKNDEDEKQDKDESSDESDDEDIVEKDNLAKEIASLIRTSFSLKVSKYIKIPNVMEKFVEFLDDAQLLRIENSIISRGEKKFGILMRKYVESKSKNTTGYVIDCFFNSIACYLNTTFSGRHGILVTTDEDVVEEFISESHAKYYTLFLGYMPNTIIKTVQMVEDKPFIVEIEFNKGDLIIVSDSIQCKFTNSTYTANKIFEVIYMNFDNNE